MKLIFKLRFYTHWGQSLWLTGNHPIPGSSDEDRAIPLQYIDSEFWQAVVEFPEGGDFNWHYILRNADGSIVHDYASDRAISTLFIDAQELLIVDSWNDVGAVQNVFYTWPFAQVLLPKVRTDFAGFKPEHVTHVFKVKMPLLQEGQTLCVLGNSPALSDWNTVAPVLMRHEKRGSFFSAPVDLSGVTFPVEYKYGIYDLATKAFVRYEDGGNRVLSEGVEPNRFTVVNDGFARLPLVAWKGAGVAIPVFSLRSESSFGIGEFSDLKLLADWCNRTGLKLIQVLPINDTSATHTRADSYPYSCISAFALHPIYLNVGAVATEANKKLLEEAEPERKRLNASEALDYEAVWKAKLDLLRQLYSSQKTSTFKSKAYQKFFVENKHWLVPYAVFCHLRDEFKTSDCSQWPEHREYDSEKIERLVAEDSAAHESIAFYYFLQFHLHEQLKDATDYAHNLGIILKGDIPIGVARNGADTWEHRELFNLDMQAGAPPDAFTDKGQNWSFPTYNWQAMKANGFKWWKQRFQQMARYFNAFRIDHILGFFRIWSIPVDEIDGLMGYFVPALPVRAEEFAARGVAFDRDRYTRPFINEEGLSELFGEEASFVKENFLEAQSGHWWLKNEFSTQCAIEAFFAQREKTASNERVRAGLQQLIGNVILFEDRHSPGAFHFRFDVQKTTSFQHLDGHARRAVWDLYIDYFFRRQDAFWRREAMEKLPDLKRATNMLICGEDLGLVPACVPDVMRELGLLSLEIQRMPKDSRQDFFRPSGAPYLSVVTASTHDMSTVREWWEEDRAVTQRFFNRELNCPGDAPVSCEPWISRAVIEQHLFSPAMWSIFQLQDLLGMDGQLREPNPAKERINVPADPRHYWGYRMHLTLESLLDAGGFNEELRQLILRNGR